MKRMSEDDILEMDSVSETDEGAEAEVDMIDEEIGEINFSVATHGSCTFVWLSTCVVLYSHCSLLLPSLPPSPHYSQLCISPTVVQLKSLNTMSANTCR